MTLNERLKRLEDKFHKRPRILYTVNETDTEAEQGAKKAAAIRQYEKEHGHEIGEDVDFVVIEICYEKTQDKLTWV